MHIYYTILKVLYYVITSCIVGLIGWRLVASTKLSNKIIANAEKMWYNRADIIIFIYRKGYFLWTSFKHWQT